jgi:hypothetical protein
MRGILDAFVLPNEKSYTTGNQYCKYLEIRTKK